MDNIRNLVLADEKFMGDLARGLVAGKTHEQIASEAGQGTTMTVYLFLNAIKILTGKMPYREGKWTSRKQAYFKAKKWLKDPSLPQEEKDHLASLISEHEASEERYHRQNSGNNDSSSNVGGVNSAGTEVAQHGGYREPSGSTLTGTPHVQYAHMVTRSGVYVYSYPLYLTNLISPNDQRTLYKVGASAVSAGGRVKDQATKTPVPEDITLLRVFECSDAIKEERKFHRILTAAGHHHDSNHGGVEWFLTRLEMIDAIAESLGLFNTVEDTKQGSL